MMRYRGDGKPENMYKLSLEGTGVPIDDLTVKEFRRLIFGDKTVVKKTSVASQINPWLQKDVDALELSTRPQNCLRRANINTVAELVELTENQLKCLRQMGGKSVTEIKTKLAEVGLKLREE